MSGLFAAWAPSGTDGEPEQSRPESSPSPSPFGDSFGKAPDLQALEEAIARLEGGDYVPGDVQLIKHGFNTLRETALRLEDTIHHLTRLTERFI
jgi:hypothetical protein